MTVSSHAESLQQKHAELDFKIDRENQRPLPNDLLLQTWKKQKLRLKQEIDILARH
ncbi:MAG: DUF465 domain-containing protein [Pseudomonadota bacterium]